MARSPPPRSWARCGRRRPPILERWPSAIIGVFTVLHWTGLRIGSTLTRIISVSVGVMLMVLVAACFLATPVGATGAPPAATAAISLPLLSLGMLAAVVTALRAVFLTYDGWYSPIYMAEESTQPTLTMPRALIGGTLVVAAMYVIINIAILRVLPMPVLAASDLPAADAARVVLPHGGATLVTVISLLTVLSLVNAIMLMTPRILLAIGRDGFFTEKAALVSEGGTPRVALAVTSGAAAALIMSGTFEQIVAVAAVLFLLNYVSAYTALIVLRRREPAVAAAVSGVRLSVHDGGGAGGLCGAVDRGHHGGPAVGGVCGGAVDTVCACLRMDCTPAAIGVGGRRYGCSLND